MNNKTNNSKEEPKISVWCDVKTDDYYALPDSFALSGGNVTLRNCLSSKLAESDSDQLQPYLIERETAIEYVAREIENGTPEIVHYINTFTNTPIEKAQKDRSSQIESTLIGADWAQILSDCLELTPEQIENYPQLFERRLYSLVTSFINAIGESSLVAPKDRAEALLKAVKIQDILDSHGIDIGNALELAISYFNYFYLYREDTVNSEDLVSKIADLKSSNNSQESLETMMKTIVEKYQHWSQKNLDDSAKESNERIQKSVQKTFQETLEEYPLPSFSFEDLLMDENE